MALTPQGREAFRAMAVEHEAWIADFFGDLDQGEIDGLMALLGEGQGLDPPSRRGRYRTTGRRRPGGQSMTRYANPVTLPVAGYKPQHFRLCVEAGIATGDP